MAIHPGKLWRGSERIKLQFFRIRRCSSAWATSFFTVQRAAGYMICRIFRQPFSFTCDYGRGKSKQSAVRTGQLNWQDAMMCANAPCRLPKLKSLIPHFLCTACLSWQPGLGSSPIGPRPVHFRISAHGVNYASQSDSPEGQAGVVQWLKNDAARMISIILGGETASYRWPRPTRPRHRPRGRLGGL